MTGDALGTRCYLFALLLIQKRGEFSRLQSRCIEWGWGLVGHTRGLVGHTRGLIGHTSGVVGHTWGLLGHTSSLGHRACRVKRSFWICPASCGLWGDKSWFDGHCRWPGCGLGRRRSHKLTPLELSRPGRIAGGCHIVRTSSDNGWTS